MFKKIQIISSLLVGTITILQISACKDNSKYEEFIDDVNSKNAFFGIIGAADNLLSKKIIDFLYTMQIKDNNNKSKWKKWLEEKKTEINSVTINGTINIKIYEKSPYANPSNDVIKQFWNDKTIIWQKKIYHWLLDHKIYDNSKEPIVNSGIKEIQNPVDEERMFKALPIIFILNKGKLITVGQEWNLIDDNNINHFFDQLTTLITGNLLNNNEKN